MIFSFYSILCNGCNLNTCRIAGTHHHKNASKNNGNDIVPFTVVQI